MKKIKFLIIASIFLILTSFGSIWTYSVKAATERLDLTASPPVYNLSSIPGATIKDRIRVTNNSTSPLNLKIELRKLSTSGEGGDAQINPIDPNEDIVKWIRFDNPQFTALPNEYTFIPFTIKIPETAGFGYYIAFYISSSTPTEQIDGGSAVSGAVAIPILLSIKQPGAKAEGQIVEFKTKSFVNEYLPIDFTTRVSNTGNIHISPRGNIFIKSGNKDIATLNVNGGLGSILPDSKRLFESSWDDGFLVNIPVKENGNNKIGKNGKPVTRLQINWNKLTTFRFGHYTASLVLVYNNGIRDIPIESKTSFWVIPYKVILFCIVLILLIVFGLRYLLKSYVKKQLRKMKTKV